MTLSEKLFHPSGLNDHFSNEYLIFSDYIQKTRDMITQARVDMTPITSEKILNANAPYQWRSTEKNKQGLLLVHGLYDSPFMLRDLGDYFSSQGFLVRSVLLPGHGTVPGDLLNVHYSEWIKAVDYGVETLACEVEQIFIVGFSLGGVLTLHKALRDSRINGIILIAPALMLINQWLLGPLIYLQRAIACVLPNTTWYKKRDFQLDYTKYESFCCNAAQQIYQLILQTKKLLQKNKLSIPLFLTVSSDDEVISTQACLNFFASLHHPHSRLLCYTRQTHTSFATAANLVPEKDFEESSKLPIQSDTRITIRRSVFSEEKILDFSHICLPISPDNRHYGRQGDYQDFLAYPSNKAPLNKEVFLGAVSKENLKKQVMQRLTYNPDFAEMVERMRAFLMSSSLR